MNEPEFIKVKRALVFYRLEIGTAKTCVAGLKKLGAIAPDAYPDMVHVFEETNIVEARTIFRGREHAVRSRFGTSEGEREAAVLRALQALVRSLAVESYNERHN